MPWARSISDVVLTLVVAIVLPAVSCDDSSESDGGGPAAGASGGSGATGGADGGATAGGGGAGGAAGCSDGVRNGLETDVDCGGGACPPCTLGMLCAAQGDCESGHCTAETCQPEPLWARRFGDDEDQVSAAIALDADGNTLVE